MSLVVKAILSLSLCTLLAGCSDSPTTPDPNPDAGPDAGPDPATYTLAGTVAKEIGGAPLAGVTLTFTSAEASSSSALTLPTTVTTDTNGQWELEGLSGTVTITAAKDGWSFHHLDLSKSAADDAVDFTDRSAIVYVSDRDDSSGRGDIWVMNIDGSAQTRLTNNADPDGYPSWSPDHTRVLYSHRTSTNDWQLITVKPDGTDPQILLTRDSSIQAQWSPDGNRIAYSTANDIFVMNATGTASENLTNGVGGCENYAPTWSPDSAQLAFRAQGCTLSATTIFIINADGSSSDPFAQPLRTKAATQYDSDPSWSPDGDFIAFSSRNNATPGEVSTIHVIKIDGSDLRKLSQQTDTEEWSPRWTGDSQRLYYILSVPSMAGVADDIMIIPSSEEEGTPTHVLETSDWDSLSLLT